MVYEAADNAVADEEDFTLGELRSGHRRASVPLPLRVVHVGNV